MDNFNVQGSGAEDIGVDINRAEQIARITSARNRKAEDEHRAFRTAVDAVIAGALLALETKAREYCADYRVTSREHIDLYISSYVLGATGYAVEPKDIEALLAAARANLSPLVK